jgi:hypothetical protein
VQGGAQSDPGFRGGGQRIKLSVDTAGASGPFEVEVELHYQPIGYRWAENLRAFKSAEISRFTGYFQSDASHSATTLASARARSR